MRRRRFLLQTAGLTGAAAYGLSGCGSGSSKTSLHLMVGSYDKTVGSKIGDDWGTLAKDYQKVDPDVEIHVERIPYLKLDKAIADRVKAGKAPDIAQSNYFATYAEAGKLYPVSELFDIPTQADFIQSFAQAGVSHYVQYGIPILASTPRLFYNTRLFKAAGVSAPASWDELRTAAQALKRIGVPTPYGLQLGPEAAEDEALSWLLAGGGTYAGVTGYEFATPSNIATLTWLRDNLVADGLAGSAPHRLSRTPAYAQFMRGQIGMMLAHPVLLPTLEQTKFPYAHAAFPMKGGGEAPPLGLNGWMLAFNQNGHKKACGDFLTYLYKKKTSVAYSGGAAALPVTASASDTLRSDPARRPLWKFIDQMPRAEFQPVNLASWPEVQTAIRTDIGKAVVRGGDPRGVLASLDTEASRAEIDTAR
ncbi:extracellular solute-binding protein [Streptomyces sp. NPDC058067]|uniref:extracellular solute-binding protein n=1 Tax=Streptomyces sp. NPDC058067 TaxID=3346324 RepID=UPI0036E4C3D0